MCSVLERLWKSHGLRQYRTSNWTGFEIARLPRLADVIESFSLNHFPRVALLPDLFWLARVHGIDPGISGRGVDEAGG